MVVLPKKGSEATAVTVEVEQELTLLRGFRDLVGERFGYWMGRRLTQQELNDATKEERKVTREIRKTIKDNLPTWIENADIDSFNGKNEELAEANKVVKEKSKPFREKIAPLSKGIRYIDNIAIPDALKELGTPVQPRFKLSEYIDKRIAEQKTKK